MYDKQTQRIQRSKGVGNMSKRKSDSDMPFRRSLIGRLVWAERDVQDAMYMLGLYPDSELWQRLTLRAVNTRNNLANRIAKRSK